MQSKLEALSKKTGNSSYRLSEQQQILYGGRGVNKGSDELVYLNGKNADAPKVNRHSSDAWVTYANANGVTGIKRADQAEREFYKEGTFS